MLCVGECFDKLSSYINENVTLYQDDVKKSIENYFLARHKFFDANKEFRQIFCDAVLQTPEHLKKQITALKKGFDSINRRFLEKILAELNLRENISTDEAIDYFIKFQEFFNNYFQNNEFRDSSVSDIIMTHEIQCHKIFDIILYGIAKQEDKK